MYFLMVGNPFDGMALHGHVHGWKDPDEASEFAERNFKNFEWWVIECCYHSEQEEEDEEV